MGRKAKEGERNMVQITTEDEDGDEVSHTILSLRAGGTEQVGVVCCHGNSHVSV